MLPESDVRDILERWGWKYLHLYKAGIKASWRLKRNKVNWVKLFKRSFEPTGPVFKRQTTGPIKGYLSCEIRNLTISEHEK